MGRQRTCTVSNYSKTYKTQRDLGVFGPYFFASIVYNQDTPLEIRL